MTRLKRPSGAGSSLATTLTVRPSDKGELRRSAAIGRARPTGTVACMRINGAHIDQRRLLLPRDYAADPDLFGHQIAVRFLIPHGGDELSMQVARSQHLMLCAWRQRTGGPGTTLMRRRFGISAAVWSRTTRGQRWAGETCFAALAHVLLRDLGHHSASRNGS